MSTRVAARWRWSAAKARVELAKERAQPTATRAQKTAIRRTTSRTTGDPCDRPPDLLVTDDRVVARRELAGLRLIHRRPKGVSRLVPGEGLSMRGCKGSPLRRARRERRLWQPDRRPRVRLREPPRQESAVALPACPRARRPGCPRLPGADGCQREPSPETTATPARRNRQPRARQGGGLLRSASSRRVRDPSFASLTR